MKVKATTMGQYKGRMIERGEVFDIAVDKEFSPRWMEKVVEADPKERRKLENDEERQAIDEALLAEKLVGGK